MYIPNMKDLVRKSEFWTKLTEDGFIEIDSSTFDHVDGCFTAGLYNAVLKRVSSRTATPLIFGGAVHEGLEAFFKGASEAEAIKVALATAELDELDSFSDAKRNTTKLVDLLKSYFLDYTLSTGFTPVTLPDGDLAVELPFSYPLGRITIEGKQITVMWQGKIDLLHQESTNEVSVVDHKTTSIMGAQFADDKMRSNQVLGYVWATREILKNDSIKVKKMIINAIATRAKGFDFAKFDIPVTEWMITEWKTEILSKLSDFTHALVDFVENEQAVPTRHSCVTKYGKCSYFNVCQTAPAVRASMLINSGDFDISTWSPLNA